MEYTESQIKTIGGKRYFKRKTKRIMLLSVLTLAWIPLAMYMVKGNPTFNNYHIIIKLFMYLAPFLLVASNIFIGYKQACKVFLEKVKKNPSLLE